MRHVGDTREGTWPAEPLGSISGDALRWDRGSKRLQLTESFGLPREGALGCSTTLLSPPCTALPCGKLEKPRCPRGRAPASLCAGQGAAGAVGWDGMGSMSDIKHPQPHGPLGDRWQCLHVLLPGTATRDLAFLVQEVDDSAQHSHHQDGHDDGHDDHPLALCC